MRLGIYVMLNFLICSKCAVFLPQEQYLRKKQIECGVPQNVNKGQSSQGTSSRIINGEPSDENYPWLVQVLSNRKGYKNSSLTRLPITLTTSYYCGGGLITDKAVLTAAHCVCSGKDQSTATENWPVTCEPDRISSKYCINFKRNLYLSLHGLKDNQNQRDKNEVPTVGRYRLHTGP